MSFPKNIIKVDLPHILGDPIVEISFLLNSENIELTLELDRIYNVYIAEIVTKSEDEVTIKCSEDSKVFVYSRFTKIQDIYYYPFISSVFGFNKLKVESDLETWLEISIHENFKSLTFYSYVWDNTSNERYWNKQKETWLSEKGIFHYPVFTDNFFRFAVRTTGRSINYGLVHLVLPFLIILTGLVFRVGNLSKGIQENAPAILFAVLLTFTPFYINILQAFIARSFMSLNLGMFFYVKSYILAIAFVLVYLLFPKYTFLLAYYFVAYVSILLICSFSYFRKGEFPFLIKLCIFKPLIFLIRLPYLIAWFFQKVSKRKQQKKYDNT